jgi:hypothetical protein
MNLDLRLRQIRLKSWASATLVLILFFLLGLVAHSVGLLIEGFHHLPVATRVAASYGPIAFPLLGVGAAISIILTDIYLWNRWFQWVLILLSVLISYCLLRVLVGGWEGITSSV